MTAYLWLNRWLQGEEGQGLVEYGLIIALVSIALIVVLMLVTGSLGTIYNTIATVLNGAA